MANPKHHHWKQGALFGKPLSHTSFWLDPWVRMWIREVSFRANISQSLLLTGLVLDFYTRTLPAQYLDDPQYKRLQKHAQAILSTVV